MSDHEFGVDCNKYSHTLTDHGWEPHRPYEIDRITTSEYLTSRRADFQELEQWCDGRNNDALQLRGAWSSNDKLVAYYRGQIEAYTDMLTHIRNVMPTEDDIFEAREKGSLEDEDRIGTDDYE